MAGFRQLIVLSVSIVSFVLPTTFAAGDESILHSEVARANNQSLLWGPYRPNLYFGVRPRLPSGLMSGLMWAKVDNYDKVQHSKMASFPDVTSAS